MKILFVSSGNSLSGISPIIKNQGLSIKKQGVDISYFTIKGRGIVGYLKNVKILKNFIKENDFDIIHAHYSMSAFVASLAGAKPLVVSLMGSDVKSDKLFKLFIYLFNRLTWSKVIIKSKDMQSSLGIKKSEIIPNGVDLKVFKPMELFDCKRKLGWDNTKKQILFASNPNRYEKNYPLAKKAFSLLLEYNYELKVLEDVSKDEMPLYFNASDIVILTSLWEGSPNVIKEAMACNRPILSTNVGDVSTLLNNVNGCEIVKRNAQDIADKIVFFIEKFPTSRGREKIKLLKIDSENIATKIIKLYKELKYGK